MDISRAPLLHSNPCLRPKGGGRRSRETKPQLCGGTNPILLERSFLLALKNETSDANVAVSLWHNIKEMNP